MQNSHLSTLWVFPYAPQRETRAVRQSAKSKRQHEPFRPGFRKIQSLQREPKRISTQSRSNEHFQSSSRAKGCLATSGWVTTHDTNTESREARNRNHHHHTLTLANIRATFEHRSATQSDETKKYRYDAETGRDDIDAVTKHALESLLKGTTMRDQVAS